MCPHRSIDLQPLFFHNFDLWGICYVTSSLISQSGQRQADHGLYPMVRRDPEASSDRRSACPQQWAVKIYSDLWEFSIQNATHLRSSGASNSEPCSICHHMHLRHQQPRFSLAFEALGNLHALVIILQFF
jgi:hypothetical protein